MWYVVDGDVAQTYIRDPSESKGCEWFTLIEVMALSSDLLDPRMHRFVEKMEKHWLPRHNSDG